MVGRASDWVKDPVWVDTGHGYDQELVNSRGFPVGGVTETPDGKWLWIPRFRDGRECDTREEAKAALWRWYFGPRDGWIGVDLDGVLAYQDASKRFDGSIGEPIPASVEFVKNLLRDGEDVRIFTARVARTGLTNEWGVEDSGEFVFRQRKAIEQWCKDTLGLALPVTATKDFLCKAIYDDIAVPVKRNEGVSV